LLCRFAGQGPCSFCCLHPKISGCVSEHGRSIPLGEN
jgi:hypothetical protein